MDIRRAAVAVCLLFCLPALPGFAASKTIVVSAEGKGDFKTLQEAIAAVPENSPDRTVIHIKPGVYEGPFVVSKSQTNVTLEGESVEKTILTYDKNVRDPRPPNSHIFNPGLDVLGNDFRAENLTIQNTSGDHGQALAIHMLAERVRFRNCRILGWQDTLLLDKGHYDFQKCSIEGRVDFIFGEGVAVFDRCDIHSKNGGFVTAASTKQNVPYGFVFLNCKLTGDPKPWVDPTGKLTQFEATPAKTALGRPWGPYASVAFIDCKMGDHIAPAGWDNWGKVENETTSRYAEYGTRTLKGKLVDLSVRASWGKKLTSEEAKKYQDIVTVLGGWNPDA